MPSTSQRPRGAVKDKSVVKTVLVYLNLVIVAFLSVALVGVTRRINTTDTEKRTIENELSRTRAGMDLLSRRHEENLADAVRRERTEREKIVKSEAEKSAQIDALSARLQTIESQARSTRVETAASFRRELEDLKNSLKSEFTPKKDFQQVFRDFEQSYGRGVVLIYTEFDYCRVRDGKEGRAKTVTGWGSGFFVSDDGFIVTNKHVIYPWKFDQDLATMITLGEIKVDESSLRIACWESGMHALEGEDHPSTSVGYNTFELKNLRIFATAEDHMSDRNVDTGSYGPKYRVHDLDNNDLVILKAEGKNFAVLPTVEHADDHSLKKLDAVMALGYPRGQNGLESAVVQTSPSIGTVRKVENTIHVTASIIPGNSGGPLIGPDGRVVGIVTRIYSETLGICIKIDHALNLIAAGKKAEHAVLDTTRVLPALAAAKLLHF